ncbi:ATP binding [Ceratobasidium sp. 428]|nr:ATP binding [Ceratobasidium sp. 428]
MSPELLQDEAGPTPESDMWAFGNVAFWVIFSGLEPYPEHKNEIEVIAQITRGIPPNGPNQLEKLEDLGGTPIPEDSLWQTSGTWEFISKCWNVAIKHRPTATQFLDNLENQSNMSERSGLFDHWNVTGIIDLTGRIKKSETTHYDGLSLGYSRGIWRGEYDGRGTQTTYITLWCRKTTLSQGFFRSTLDVVIKGVQLTPKNSTTYAARQSIRHELLLLKQLQHNNICSLLGFDQQYMQFSGVPGIVLEYCSDGTLQEYLTRKFDKLDQQDKKELIKDLCKALHYLHHELPQGSIVHGNLSTETVLIDTKGNCKLSSFEFACQYTHADNILEAPVIFAPPIAPPPSRWHAPEYFEGPSDVWPNPTQFTDMWALGCLIVAVWTNSLPFVEHDSPGALSQIINGSKPYSEEDCSSQVWGIVTRLWASPHYDRILMGRLVELVEAINV